jgi:hypothetical protein
MTTNYQTYNTDASTSVLVDPSAYFYFDDGMHPVGLTANNEAGIASSIMPALPSMPALPDISVDDTDTDDETDDTDITADLSTNNLTDDDKADLKIYFLWLIALLAVILGVEAIAVSVYWERRARRAETSLNQIKNDKK